MTYNILQKDEFMTYNYFIIFIKWNYIFVSKIWVLYLRVYKLQWKFYVFYNFILLFFVVVVIFCFDIIIKQYNNISILWSFLFQIYTIDVVLRFAFIIIIVRFKRNISINNLCTVSWTKIDFLILFRKINLHLIYTLS